MNHRSISLSMIGLIGMGLPLVAFPLRASSQSARPAANEPTCYIVTKTGSVTNLSALCGVGPQSNDQPTDSPNANTGNTVNSPRPQSQINPRGQTLVPRLNVRNNRDTQKS